LGGIPPWSSSLRGSLGMKKKKKKKGRGLKSQTKKRKGSRPGLVSGISSNTFRVKGCVAGKKRTVPVLANLRCGCQVKKKKK